MPAKKGQVASVSRRTKESAVSVSKLKSKEPEPTPTPRRQESRTSSAATLANRMKKQESGSKKTAEKPSQSVKRKKSESR